MGRYTEDMLDSSIRGYDKLFKGGSVRAARSSGVWSEIVLVTGLTQCCMGSLVLVRF